MVWTKVPGIQEEGNISFSKGRSEGSREEDVRDRP